MRIGPIAESWLERVTGWLGLGPRPLLDTHTALLLAQTVMAATRLGVFECLAMAALPATEVATRCRTAAGPTAKLLDALVASGYLRHRGSLYTLTRDARRWLLQSSPGSLHDNILFRFVEWDWIGGLEGFVRSGEGVDIHDRMSGEQWEAYQRGMRSLARCLAREVVWRTPVPKGAVAMLDIGGAHGLFAAALCRRYAGLKAEILDLPDAVASAAPMLAAEGLGDRVVHRPDDALTADLGLSRYDLVFIANLLHHFAPAQIRDLISRAARALRPGGILVVQEMFSPSSSRSAGQVGALADLYFALTSSAGTLSAADIAVWQSEAGLEPRREIRFISFPGAGQQNAVKPRGAVRSGPEQ